ncbi:MAG: single-stranded-DNA-specific exonuclease RecJ [Patescibacteria group bacterium]|nr:single-stranded-DNA-specific exonuclease RecJ [Patescibacteria group bacterium]
MHKYDIRRPLTAAEQSELSAYPPFLAHLLFHRGLAGAEAAGRFLGPDYDAHIHDPFLLKDAEKAADRIINAVKSGEKIAIYADYDADGIPGAAIWNDFFGRIGFKDFVVYIPHRHDEGFGLNEEAVEELAGQGVKLIVTVDCGIADIGPVEKANELNMDVIITDHHEPPVSPDTGLESLPPALAVIDHKRGDCPYPDKSLCGSGVAFKLIQAILKKERFGLKEGHEKWLLDLVGLATLSDMVSLTGENRVFAYYGMQVLRKTPRKGLRKLFDRLRMRQSQLTEDDMAFMVTPRINAASRMGVPMDAFDLLAADNDDDAARFAERLDAVNNERKGVVASLVKEVKKKVRERFRIHDSGFKNKNETADGLPSVIVLGNPEWRPSLLGLAANSCAEEFDRPVFLWGRDGGNVIKGSCRSEGRTHVVELMRAASAGSFMQFGGHKHSGGFAVENDAVHYLEQRLNEAAQKIQDSGFKIQEDGKVETYTDSVDAELKLEDVDWKMFNDVNRLAPFGVGNPKPVFLFRNVVPVQVKKFGKGSEHIELVFKKSDGSKVSAISFFGADNEAVSTAQPGEPLDLIASLEKSTFRSTPELRLRVVDVVTS